MIWLGLYYEACHDTEQFSLQLGPLPQTVANVLVEFIGIGAMMLQSRNQCWLLYLLRMKTFMFLTPIRYLFFSKKQCVGVLLDT